MARNIIYVFYWYVNASQELTNLELSFWTLFCLWVIRSYKNWILPMDGNKSFM